MGDLDGRPACASRLAKHVVADSTKAMTSSPSLRALLIYAIFDVALDFCVKNSVGIAESRNSSEICVL